MFVLQVYALLFSQTVEMPDVYDGFIMLDNQKHKRNAEWQTDTSTGWKQGKNHIL